VIRQIAISSAWPNIEDVLTALFQKSKKPCVEIASVGQRQNGSSLDDLRYAFKLRIILASAFNLMRRLASRRTLFSTTTSANQSVQTSKFTSRCGSLPRQRFAPISEEIMLGELVSCSSYRAPQPVDHVIKACDVLIGFLRLPSRKSNVAATRRGI